MTRRLAKLRFVLAAHLLDQLSCVTEPSSAERNGGGVCQNREPMSIKFRLVA
jgi:hypothetical protein